MEMEATAEVGGMQISYFPFECHPPVLSGFIQILIFFPKVTVASAMENQWPGETLNLVTATTHLRSPAAAGASSTPGSAPRSSSTGVLWRSIFPAAPATTHEASQLYVKQNAPPRARTQAMALPGSLGPGLDFSLQVFIGVCCFFETINSKKFSFQDS